MSNYVPPTTPIGGPTGQPFPPQQPFPPPPQKKSNVLTWVLVGCGTFVILGVIAVFLGGYFVWNKAKEAGIDPALMEKKPALAIAKMMVAANPDVELVSTDDEKGLITVRDKKTGKTMTVNLEEAQSGKITFKGDDNGEEVSLEAKGDGEKGSLEVKTPEGTAKFGSVSVDKLPDWLPAYPGAELQGTYAAEGKDGESGGFHFVTNDAPNKVIGFYEEGLKRSGMTVNTNILQQNGKVTGGMATGESANKKHTAFINAMVGDQGTQVTVVFTIKP
jgi:hypothetical protein